jgi:predicted Ser/Thr protein kinase
MKTLKIGSGNNGAVYEMCSSYTNCPYVVKVVNFQNNVTRRELFELEVKTAKFAGLRGFGPEVIDSFICDPVDASAHAKGVIVMKRIRGETLRKSMGNASSQVHRNELFDSALDAITLMHDAGVFHQDLHCDNIMVEDDERYEVGKCWIIDFNTAFVFNVPLNLNLRYHDLCYLIESHKGIYKFGVCLPNIVDDGHDDELYRDWARTVSDIELYTHIAKSYQTSNITGKSREVIREMLMVGDDAAEECISILTAPLHERKHDTGSAAKIF